MKVLSLFSGIGAFEKALKRQNIKYELVNYCEIDKYAAKSYSLIHNESEDKNLGDITKVDETKLPDFDLMTWGFPCTDISIAGKQKGFIDEEGNQTRSGLYSEGLRILKHKKPKYSIIENVKALTQKKFKAEFEQILNDLTEAGYNNYWQVLNAKDYGIPQNRERIFIVSIRKDIDNESFQFPEGFDNGIRLKDVLEDIVDEKYYISQDKTDKLIAQLKNKSVSDYMRISNTITSNYKNGCATDEIKKNRRQLVIESNNKLAMQINRGKVKIKEDDICSCIDANYWKELDNHASRTGIIQVGMLDIKGNEQVRRVYDQEGLSPILNSIQGGNRQPKIIEENELKFIGGIDTTDKWINTDKDLSRNYKEGYRVYDSEGIACCQKTNGGGLGSHTGLYKVEDKKNDSFIENKYKKFIDENGYIPEMFNLYNCAEIKDISPSITTQCGSTTSSATVLKLEKDKKSPVPELVGGIGDINFGKQYRQGNRVYSSDKTAMCLLSQPVGNTGGNSYLYYIYCRIRKLTPLECLRLMGFDDEDYYILKRNGISDSQIYKMAGNSIVVDVLEKIVDILLK